MKLLKIDLALYLVFLIFSIVCGICSFLGKGPNNLLGGMVCGFGVVGIIGIFNSIRIMKNPKKVEEIEIYKNEERAVFIRGKTNSKVYSIFIYIESVIVIICAVLGYRTISMVISFLLMAKLVAWFIIGTYYSKKY